MKATYKLELEQQQRRLGLTHNQLNRLDRKHNNHNLIKYLQSLEVTASAPPPPSNTGWYGTFQIGNTGETFNSLLLNIDAVDNAIVTEILGQITLTSEDSSNDYYTLTLPIENRLKSPSTILRIYHTPITGSIQDIAPDVGLQADNYYYGYTEMTVQSGYYDDGFLGLYFTLG